ncbi:MAG TPA: type II toxin-antitoxin system prevent-host-death family antitoxin [Vicinamibacterales bacterium]|nr:type II toxin-antitoxin system prevent-host-death family antitoxin [Vicinamibacterales bacterium]
MKRASITAAKNRLSALIDQVRDGEPVLIEDRGVPVARLESVAALRGDDRGRVERLERAGLARRASAPIPRAVVTSDPPAHRGRARASEILIAERREDR